MDGAMGTELRRAGLGDNECGELWNLTYPEKVRAIHLAYAGAGAEVLLANTFQANPAAMRRHGKGEQDAKACWIAAASIGQTLPDQFLVGDIGPTGGTSAEEFADLSFIRSLAEANEEPVIGWDALLLETCSTPQALEAAHILSEHSDTLLSVAYKRDPHKGLVSNAGQPPEWFAARAPKHGVAALGVNCGLEISVADCAEIIRRYRKETDLPLFARPNAGTPTKSGEQWLYPRTPERMVERLPELLEAGVCMVGGCCGTTPAHIAAFREVVDRWNARIYDGAEKHKA
jgi:methionine synthase I (cobalamin-dependent)